jgi:MFS superfamily sulfate permease-like transporter
VLGFVKAGTISTYFPTAVIEGMLVAIGIIIIKKELPHAIGYDKAHEGDWFALENGAGGGYFTEIINAINYAHVGAIVITLVSLGIIIAFNKVSFLKKIKVIPGALIVVIAGVVLNEIFIASGSKLAISQEHLVTLPSASSFNEFIGQFTTPNFAGFTDPKTWIVGLTIAIVASIETLLCLEAGDKMDHLKR